MFQVSEVLTEDIKAINEYVLDGLNSRFGKVGPLIYDILTSPYALGNNLIQPSKTIVDRIGREEYRQSVDKILDEINNIDFQQRLKPLLEKVEKVEAPGTKKTFGDALNIIQNIFQNDEAIAQLRAIVTIPNNFDDLLSL